MRLNNSKELADYIKLQRKKQGRTQTDVAEHIGLKQKTISGMENSAGSSRIDTLFKIAHELGLSFELTPIGETKSGKSKESGWDQEW
ncbi:helix-turn-helix domain-containing protein [Thalassotalea sp. LPB0316]|uniref:helix-turn-helix domain-containing protein n=1 Tax=Thalassotalea sp. LPB0316 TaxID=2769490 RepID=UPI0018665C7D|nr:helix-turn-helix domain-containing protein [Thalassotalea sp. LPB0316]QOL26242.1 helix-turn-helix domain-containing protein [Thalassotalea sp. LPB0316]